MTTAQNLAIGDIIAADKAFGILDHVGLVVGPNHVLHNTPARGEHIGSIDTFAPGKPIRVQRTGIHPSSIYAGVCKILAAPKPYDPALRNCEHTVTEVVEGRPRSRQLVFWMIAAGIIAALFLLSRRA